MENLLIIHQCKVYAVYSVSTCWCFTALTRCGSRIMPIGGPQLLRLKVADIAKQSCAIYSWVLDSLRAFQAFRFLRFKYAFCYILETLFLSFLTSSSKSEADKNTVHCTSINLRYFKTLHPFVNLYEKVILLTYWFGGESCIFTVLRGLEITKSIAWSSQRPVKIHDSLTNQYVRFSSHIIGLWWKSRSEKEVQQPFWSC